MFVNFCLILFWVFMEMIDDVLDYVTLRCYLVVIFERVYLCQSALNIRLSLILKAGSNYLKLYPIRL